MSKIKVNCPQCKQEVTLEKAKLSQTNGRVPCPHCAHIFHLVKKSKAAANNENKKNSPKHNDLDQIAAMFQGQKKANKASTPQSTQTALHYRIPKAPNRKPAFAEVPPQSEGFAFNLLDRDSVQSQIPQVAIKPTTANLPIPAARAGEQQNNITIHTDSLVFTLVGDGQNPMGNLTPAPMMAAAPAQISAPTIAVSSEMNWTIATIAALVVLILQLFYLIMMLI